MGVLQCGMDLGIGTLSGKKYGKDVLLVLDRLFSIRIPAVKDILLISMSTTSRILEEFTVLFCR